MKKQRCVIIGASPDTDIAPWKTCLHETDYIVCADGGYVWAQKAGLTPQLIIGDFDSADCPAQAPCEVIRLPVRKDDTDTMVCLKEGIRRGYREFLLLGMTGGRPDHTFANFAALSYLSQRGLQGTILDTEWEYRVLTDTEQVLTDREGCAFAVFPFGCRSCEVTLSGFLYEGESIPLQADFPLGVSNTIVSPHALVRVHQTALVIIQISKQGFHPCTPQAFEKA